MSDIQEKDINGKHITITKTPTGKYAATVTERVYNKKGEHVATPTHMRIGTKDEIKGWIRSKAGSDE